MVGLREYRERKKMTRKELSSLLGVSMRTIMAYELGERRPKLETMLRLSEILDISKDDMLGMFSTKSVSADAFRGYGL